MTRRTRRAYRRRPPFPGAIRYRVVVKNSSQRDTDVPNSGLASVTNALRLIRLLSSHREIRVVDAAEQLNIARSTAHRLLMTLRDNGFATQERVNSAYRLGPVVTEIGLAAIRHMDLRGSARPTLEEVRERTGETVSLSVLEGQYVRFADGLEGTQLVRVGERTGYVLPASSTAGGKAILAALPLDDLERRFPSSALPTLTPSSPARRSDLRRELERARVLGYAVNKGESESAVSAVGVAIRDPSGLPVGAIAIVFPTSRWEESAIEGWGRELLTAREHIERSIGM